MLDDEAVPFDGLDVAPLVVVPTDVIDAGVDVGVGVGIGGGAGGESVLVLPPLPAPTCVQ